MKWSILRNGYKKKSIPSYSLHFKDLLVAGLFPPTEENKLLSVIDYSHQILITGCLGLQNTQNLFVQLCLCASQELTGWSEIWRFCCLNSILSAASIERGELQWKLHELYEPPFCLHVPTEASHVVETQLLSANVSSHVLYWFVSCSPLQNPILIGKHSLAMAVSTRNLASTLLYLSWVDSRTSEWVQVWWSTHNVSEVGLCWSRFWVENLPT